MPRSTGRRRRATSARKPSSTRQAGGTIKRSAPALATNSRLGPSLAIALTASFSSFARTMTFAQSALDRLIDSR